MAYNFGRLLDRALWLFGQTVIAFFVLTTIAALFF